MLIAGLLMARLVFVLLYWQDYRNAPLGIIDIRDGGFSALGGLAGTFLLALYKAKRERSLRIPLAAAVGAGALVWALDRKSTRLNSSHVRISYAVFCLKKKTNSRRAPAR